MKKRIDVIMAERKLCESRAKAQQSILKGCVLVNGNVARKASELFCDDCKIELLEKELFVSRGGLKLLGAIDFFNINFKNQTVLDLGSSTGGFTDCALQHGSKKVFAVDVGSDQLHEKLKKDQRVVSLEKTNAKNIPESIFLQTQIIVCDLSFVSVVKIFEEISSKIKKGTQVVVLIKPQFECGKEIAHKNKGVIKKIEQSQQIANTAVQNFLSIGFVKKGFMPSPIQGGDGNFEFLLFAEKI